MALSKLFEDQSQFQGVLEFRAYDGEFYRAVAHDLRPGNRSTVLWEIYRQRSDRQFIRVGSVRSVARRPIAVWEAWQRRLET